MKEISVEEKAKRYDEILARATGAYLPYYTEDIMSKVKEFVDYLLPELKESEESEDERIKKAIKYGLDYVFTNNTTVYETTKEQCLAWLEKQGEKKHADKVEPKFKEGDIIKHNKANIIRKVISVNSGSYYVENIEKNGGIELFNAEQNFHRWTIQDAKDGDVLAYVTDEEDLWIMIYSSLYESYEGHVHYHALLVNDNFSDKGTCCIYIDDLKPATKEQRDLLFQKMKEAGYVWDAKKLELMKVEQRPTEWTAEDEEELKIALNTLEEAGQYNSAKWLKNVCLVPQAMQKSLKGRYAWKPSEEKMKWLHDAIESTQYEPRKQALISLYSDLMKLREE